jgi:hypothetical protein
MAQKRQKNSGNAQKSAVNDDLSAKGKPGNKSVRVSVPGEKQHLEDKHAHGPYGWSTTKKWKDFLSEQQLNLEE